MDGKGCWPFIATGTALSARGRNLFVRESGVVCPTISTCEETALPCSLLWFVLCIFVNKKSAFIAIH